MGRLDYLILFQKSNILNPIYVYVIFIHDFY